MENVIQVRNEYRRQQWTQIILDCQNSGLSNKEYCRQNGILEKAYYWKLRTTAAEGMPQMALLVGIPIYRPWIADIALRWDRIGSIL